nr:MAG TPA: hypothetical protein [Caudoviricetes sp.]
MRSFMGNNPAEERKVVWMKEVTIKIEDEVYEFYRNIADEHDDMSLEEVIAVAIREQYEWEI